MKIGDRFKGNAALFVARLFSGFNINALKFLLPVWIAPLSCVTLRLTFGLCVFWSIGIFEKPDTSSLSDRVKLFFIGAFAVFGYMALYAVGLSMTTPVNLAILNAMQPVWVFVLSALFLGERVTCNKVLGILVGLIGAILCLFSQPDKDLARNPLLGNLLGFSCSICYAVYIILSEKILRRVSNMTMLRYTFLGASLSSLIMTAITGFDAPMFSLHIDVKAVTALLYILLFPTVLSYLLIPIGLKYLTATAVSVYGYMTLFVATVASVLLGQDRLDDVQMSALAMMCLSIYWVSISEASASQAKSDIQK